MSVSPLHVVTTQNVAMPAASTPAHSGSFFERQHYPASNEGWRHRLFRQGGIEGQGFRAAVVRAVQQAVLEAVLLGRTGVVQDPVLQPRDRIDDHRRGQFAAGQDGDGTVEKMRHVAVGDDAAAQLLQVLHQGHFPGRVLRLTGKPQLPLHVLACLRGRNRL